MNIDEVQTDDSSYKKKNKKVLMGALEESRRKEIEIKMLWMEP